MRNKDLSGGEWPVLKMWYGKMAGKTIEEIIDTQPRYFIWMVKAFQDVTVTQAKHFQDKYEMELPPEVIQDVTPYEYIYKHSPEGEYERLCKGEITIEETYGYRVKHSSPDNSPMVKNPGSEATKPVLQSNTYPRVNISSCETSSLTRPSNIYPGSSPDKDTLLFIPPPKDESSPEYRKWLSDYMWNRDIRPNYNFYSQKDT